MEGIIRWQKIKQAENEKQIFFERLYWLSSFSIFHTKVLYMAK